MAEKRNRLDCPVCDGVQMEKIRPSDELELALDYCDKCGGMWFESGEVRQLRFCPPEILSSLISMKKQLYAVDCPSCGHSMTRNVAECPSCQRENTIDCPDCGLLLERVQGDEYTVDVCRDCRGVWFDNIDLSAVWNLHFEKSPRLSEEDTGSPDEIDTEDTVIAVLRGGRNAEPASVEESNGGNSRDVFGSIADIVGGIFSKSS